MASEELRPLFWALLLSALEADDPEFTERAYSFIRERLRFVFFTT